MTTALSINLNKIALLRNARGSNYPSVSKFGRVALNNGVNGLTLHPRPDRRHATFEDVRTLRELISEFPGTELNVEGYPTSEFLSLIKELRPHQCTLVPDLPNQITSDHGFDPITSRELLVPVIEELSACGIRVSLFVDPIPKLMPQAVMIGADRVELYTESWAQAYQGPNQNSVLSRYRETVQSARKAGLEVNAGHDLNLANLPTFLTIPAVAEVSIGHAVIVESLDLGFEKVIKRYVSICATSA